MARRYISRGIVSVIDDTSSSPTSGIGKSIALKFLYRASRAPPPSLVSKFEYSLSGPCPVDSARVEWKSAMEGWRGGDGRNKNGRRLAVGIWKACGEQ